MNAKTIISNHFKKIGRKGGKAGRGKAKARTSKQAREAVMQRWRKKKRRIHNRSHQRKPGDC